MIYSGGNTLSLKGPDGMAYNFYSGDEKEVRPLLDKINSLPISDKRKGEMLKQVEEQIDKFRPKN